jgi:cytochrome P450
MQCYTTQRDPRVFPHPESFRPERWLGDAGNNSDMNTMFMPFSAGTRACLGINLAWMELKVITAALVKHYHVHLAPGTTPESMDMIDHFLLMPKAAKCDLIFTKVK